MCIFAAIFKVVTNKAIIVGASGLIGSKLLNILLEQPEYTEVLVIVREALNLQHTKLKQVIVDFNRLDSYSGEINGHALFCCLGSTRRRTPDLTEYRKIDHDYPLRLAQIAATNGIGQYHLVSALGADPGSSNFYTKMKGETESDIKQTGLKCLHIYQPSILTGDRKEKRRMEKIAIVVMAFIDPFLIGGLRKYRSISATTVAMAMFKLSIKNEEGVFIYPSDQIKQLS